MVTMKNNAILLLIIFLLIQIGSTIYAQEIEGVVLCNNKAVACNAVLLSQDSSTIITGGFFIDGKIKIINPSSQAVDLQLSGLQFEDTIISVPLRKLYHLGIINVKSRILDDVIVRGKKEPYEVKSSGYILNVSRSYLKDLGMATDVLQMAPMLMVNSDESIRVIGKENKPLILIDGREVYDFEQIKSLPSSSIREINVITDPTAKYDANVTSVIEITTKEKSLNGFSGRIDLSGGKGINYRGKESINLAYNTKKIRLFGSYKLSQTNKSPEIDNITELYSVLDTSTLISKNSQYQEWRNKSYIAGMDYVLNKNNNLGVQINGFRYKVKTEDNWNTILPFLASYSSLSSSKLEQNRIGFNINHRVKLNNKNSQLNSYFDYLVHDQNSTESIFENYQSTSNELRNLSDSKYYILSLKSEYTQSIKKSKLDLTLGIKLSKVNGEGNLIFEEKVNGFWENNTLLSNVFKNNEEIVATYVDVNKVFGEIFSLNFGVRGEYVKRYAFDSYQSTPIIDNKSIKLFPNLQLLINISDNHKLSFNYINKIQRPPYRFLTQSITYLDSTRYFQGNPYLTPAYINDYSLRYTYKKKYGIIMKYQHINDIIDLNIYYIDNKLKTTYSNYNEFKKWSMTIFGNYSFERIDLRSSLMLSKPQMNVVQLNKPVTIEEIGLYLDFSANVRIWKNGQLHCKYYYSKNEQYGASLRNNMSNLSVGITQKFQNDRLVARFTANDIFKQEKYGGSRFVGMIKEQRVEFQDTKTFIFSLSFLFNKYKKVTKKSGLEDERYRL